MDKSLLRAAILNRISTELDTQRRAAEMAHDEATHEESKPENQYDMHAQEAAYLAEGQARLVAELSETLGIYQNLPLPSFAPDAAIGLGAVVTLEHEKKRSVYFLGPRNGGMEFSVDGTDLTVITPNSPLGRQLLGSRKGAVVQMPGRPPAKGQIVGVE